MAGSRPRHLLLQVLQHQDVAALVPQRRGQNLLHGIGAPGRACMVADIRSQQQHACMHACMHDMVHSHPRGHVGTTAGRVAVSTAARNGEGCSLASSARISSTEGLSGGGDGHAEEDYWQAVGCLTTRPGVFCLSVLHGIKTWRACNRPAEWHCTPCWRTWP